MLKIAPNDMLKVVATIHFALGELTENVRAVKLPVDLDNDINPLWITAFHNRKNVIFFKIEGEK